MSLPFTTAELDAIKAAAEAATPGPWRWELNEKSKRVALQGGKPKYDCTVMDFVRYGMNGAMPRFVTEPKPFMNIMKPCTAYAKEVEGREHHADWFKTIDNQDANFIATLDPATVLRLVEQIKRLTKQVDEYGKVMTNVVPGEHGEGEEVPATPESIRYLLKELQSEWDNSERKVSKLQAALVEQARSIGWQPIETAPKDGTEIIASKNGKLFIVDWSPQNGWTTRNGNLINPDGWFPLPKPLEAK